MAWGAKVLRTKAVKFELNKLEVLKVTNDLALTLEPVLQDVYATRRPKPTEYDVRRDLVRVFNDIAKEIYYHSKDIPVVVEFGSFVMDLFSTTSDLDLSVNFKTTNVPCPREKQIQTLRKFAKKLYAIQSKGHVYGVLPITTAKVPILKCVDRGTGVECDISVENRDGILKSHIIHIILSIDERFQKLSFLMKTWAKAYNINSSKDKTLNSLSIILLVAFHLQTRDPPILPPFSSIFQDGTDRETVEKSMSKFVNYGKRNTESLAELFITLLIKLSSVEKLWPKGLCASTYKASWMSKTWDSKVASISVEDFTDPSQNVARAVGQAEVKRIHKCIDITLKHIFSLTDGRVGSEVRDLLFGQDGISAATSLTRRRGFMNPAVPGRILIPHQANQSKRVATEKKRKSKVESSSAKKKMRNVEGGGISTQHGTIPYEPMRRQMGGWEVTPRLQSSAGGWDEETPRLQPSAGGWDELASCLQPRAGGWGEGTPRLQPSALGWGEGTSRLPPSARGWGEGNPRLQPSAGGWDELASRLQPRAGGWGEGAPRLQPSDGGWGEGTPRLQPSSLGWGEGTSRLPPSAGGWGEGNPRLQPSGGGWGEGNPRLQPSAGGWDEGTSRLKPCAGGWDEGTPRLQPSAGGWGEGAPRQLGTGGWGEAQRHHTVGRGWGGNSW